MAPLDVKPNELEPYWVPFTRQPRLQEAAAPVRGRQGHALLQAGRHQGDRRHLGPVLRQCRPLPRADRQGDPGAGGQARLFAGLPVRPSQGVRAGLAAVAAGARRSRLRVLLQLGQRGGRHRAEDRARLSQGQGRRRAHPLHRPRARLSRHRLRRHLGRRHGRQPQAVRQHADGRRPPAGDLQSRQAGLHQGRARVGRAPGRRADPPHQPARCLHHRRRHRRAGGGLDRHPAAAQGLPEEAARDHGAARHPADLRRGHHRLRPARPLLRLRALRRRRPT